MQYVNNTQAFTFYRNYYEITKYLQPKDRLQLYDAILEYMFEDNETELKEFCRGGARHLYRRVMSGNNLIIGLGGTGGRVLKELRKRLYVDGFLGSSSDSMLPVSFIYIDSTDELMHYDDPSWITLDGYNAQFTPSEFLNINTIDLNPIVAAPTGYYPQLQHIINKKVIESYRP